MYVKRDYFLMTPLEVYELVATGKLKKFPNNYLNRDIIKEIVRHLFLNVYQFTREDICLKIDHKFLEKIHLGGARKFFNMYDSQILIYSFPEMELNEWEFQKVNPHFWKLKKNQARFIKWIAKRENLNLKKKEDLRKITAPVITKHGGSKAIVNAGGVFPLLKSVTGNKFKEWEICKISSWSEELAIKATRWLVEDKLKLTFEEATKLTVADFTKYNLDGMLQKKYNHSIFKALQAAYPGTFYRDKARGVCLIEE